MSRSLRWRGRPLDRWALPLGATGLVAVALYNWRCRQRDTALLSAKGTPSPIPELETWPALPLVSVLVAAWNEADCIERHIESFLTLRYPYRELVLCAGGADATYRLAQSYSGSEVKVIEQQPGEGKQRALARSFHESRGEVIFLTDADCLLADDPFERTILPLICDGEDAATGRYSPLPEQRNKPFVLQQWWVESYARERSAHYVEGLIGRNAAVRRDALEAVGGFDGEIPIGTDYYLAHRLVTAGRRIRYVHDSMIETRFHTSFKPYLQQQSRWLRNVLWHGPRMRAHRQFYSALWQCLIGLGFWTLLLAWPLVGVTAFLIWSLLLVHGTVARLRYIAFGAARAHEPLSRHILLESPLYSMLDQVAAAYALMDWMRPSHRKQW